MMGESEETPPTGVIELRSAEPENMSNALDVGAATSIR